MELASQSVNHCAVSTWLCLRLASEGARRYFLHLVVHFIDDIKLQPTKFRDFMLFLIQRSISKQFLDAVNVTARPYAWSDALRFFRSEMEVTP